MLRLSSNFRTDNPTKKGLHSGPFLCAVLARGQSWRPSFYKAFIQALSSETRGLLIITSSGVAGVRFTSRRLL